MDIARTQEAGDESAGTTSCAVPFDFRFSILDSIQSPRTGDGRGGDAARACPGAQRQDVVLTACAWAWARAPRSCVLAGWLAWPAARSEGGDVSSGCGQVLG